MKLDIHGTPVIGPSDNPLIIYQALHASAGRGETMPHVDDPDAWMHVAQNGAGSLQDEYGIMWGIDGADDFMLAPEGKGDLGTVLYGVAPLALADALRLYEADLAEEDDTSPKRDHVQRALGAIAHLED